MADELADTQPRDHTVTDARAADEPVLDGSLELGRGTPLDRFLVIDRLGAGGMGVVVSAYDPQLDRKVAIKLLKPKAFAPEAASEAETRLLREAQAMARVSHSNVITVHEVGTYRGQVFIAMEYVDGGTLRQAIDEGCGGWRRIARLFLAAGRGLAAAHRKGLVHRDFKPENVLVDRDGRVVVTDFGLVSICDEGSQVARLPGYPRASSTLETLTQTGAVMGTPAYMAPEQHLGRTTDVRSDQFSFCAAFYEALYGSRPFAGETVDELTDNVISGRLRRPARRANVPGWLHRLVCRGLSVSPEDRYPSMHELLGDLDRNVRPSRSLHASVAVAAGLAFAAAAVLLMTLAGGGEDRARGEVEALRDELARKETELEKNRAALARERERARARTSERLASLERARRELERQHEEKRLELLRVEEQLQIVAPAAAGRDRPRASTEVGAIELRGRERVVPRAPPPAPDEALVRAAFQTLHAEVMRCGDPPDFGSVRTYAEWEKLPLTRFQGRVVVTVRVRPDGSVISAGAEGGPSLLRRCVLGLVRAQTFPPSQEGGELAHAYPFS